MSEYEDMDDTDDIGNDIEDIDDIDNEAPDSLADLAVSGLTKIDWFLLLIVALSFLFVISDVFINQILTKFPDAVQHKEPTAWGSLIQMTSQLFFIISATAIKTYW